MSIISVSHLTHVYRSGWGRRRRVRALDDVSFDVEEGEVFGLLGTSGAGKTTIIKCLLGVVHPEEGEIAVLGRQPDDTGVKNYLGCLPEAYPYDRFLTGETYLHLFGGLAGMSGCGLTRSINALAAEFGLLRDLHRPLVQYSKGMCQRLGLMAAMLHCPRLLLLDEPTDGLDPLGRITLRALFRRLREEGMSIVLNSHILSEVEMVCDRVAILHKGRIVRTGRVKDLTGDRPVTAIRIDAADRSGISDFPEGLVVEESGQACNLLLNSPEEVNSMLDRLRRDGIRILEVQPRTATLEEVFLRTLGGDVGEEMRT